MMKKIFAVIVLFISVAISASAQKTVGELREGFKEGSFYITIDDSVGNYTTLMFRSIYETEKCDTDGNIKYAVFETVANTEITEKGEEWFKERMKDEDLQMLVGNELFYDGFGIVIGDDYTVTDDGRARVTMTLMK